MASRAAVFCRETFWHDTIRVSTNVLAEQFVADGWRCAWLTTPVTLTRRWWHDTAQRRRLALWRRGGVRRGEVLEYAPATPLAWSWRRGLRSVWLGRNALRFACPSVARVLARHGYGPRPALLWIGSLSMASAAVAIAAERIAYHAHDLFMDYPGAPPELRTLERWLIGRADAVFTTADGTRRALVERYGVDERRVHMLGHGVHLERYRGPTAEPPELARIPRPRAVLLGTLAEADAALVGRLFGRRTDVHLVCIGPGNEHIAAESARRGLRNVHLLGARAHETVPAYLRHVDVGLVLYPFAGATTRRAGCSPMKVYEYAAAGLPVVSTWLPEYETYGAPVLAARDPGGLEAALDRALAENGARRGPMRAFARQHSWEAKYRFVCERLGL
jgi:glycosyltransferase involved in cell wall biosynthesis